jgi:hypothetical protein
MDETSQSISKKCSSVLPSTGPPNGWKTWSPMLLSHSEDCEQGIYERNCDSPEMKSIK